MIRKLTVIALLIVELGFASKVLANELRVVQYNEVATEAAQPSDGALEATDSEATPADSEVAARTVDPEQSFGGFADASLDYASNCHRVCRYTPYGWRCGVTCW